MFPLGSAKVSVGNSERTTSTGNVATRLICEPIRRTIKPSTPSNISILGFTGEK